ncbi:MAG: tRNA (adenosine(37)-N6)-threonylcarbamoyltransferase complex ATPase subunit type 1 TsaE [Clostridiaceae bacterium]|nr:tRNA (adenosine(37)-N6)-threonylcarbamoyltransferase complex ATPase subunit type 1 TsaE [Clostridiaceae bacterium]
MEIRRLTSSPAQTYEIGRELASHLLAGDVVILTGSLGAGKTCLVRGIAAGLGVKGHVSSPTFTILHPHEPGDKRGVPLHHFDVYRLRDADEFVANGFDELITGDVISLIEWGDRVRIALPKEILEIAITYGEKPDERVLALRFPEYRAIVDHGGDNI